MSQVPFTIDNAAPHILLFSKGEDANNIYRILTRRLGFESVQVVQDYESAITKLKQNEYDIMLLDLDVENLASTPRSVSLSDMISETTRSFVSVLMMSRDVSPETVAFAFKKGAIDFIPIVEPTLETTLREKILYYMEERISLMGKNDEGSGSVIVNNLKILLKTSYHDDLASETILAPIELVIKTISTLLEGNFSSHQQRLLLSGILRSLIRSQNVYRPELKEGTNASPWFTSDYLNAIKSNNIHNGGHSFLSQQNTTEEVETALSLEYVFPPKATEESPIENLHSFDFDMFQYNMDRLTKSIVQMFESFNLINHFQIDVGKLISFINEVRGKYLPNLYHSFEHAWDVVQFTYACLHDPSIEKVLNTPLDKFIALVAALGHDIGHEGLNNSFQKRTHSQLALLYNDEHCLEHYHSSTLFTLLRKSRNFILEHLEEDDYSTFREFVINAILCTDPERHCEILAKFNSTYSTGEIEPTKENKKLVIAMIVKSADISNVTRPFHLAELWAERVIQEYLSQGDKEASLGLSVNSLNDRKQANKSALQMGFIKFFATPLFESMANAFPSLKHLKTRVEDNHRRWSEINKLEEETGNRPRYDNVTSNSKNKKQRKNLLAMKEFSAVEIRTDVVSGISILCISPYSESIDIFRELLMGYNQFLSENTIEDALRVVNTKLLHMIIIEEDESFDVKPLIEKAEEKQIPIFMLSDNNEEPRGVTQFAGKPVLVPNFFKHCNVCLNRSLEQCLNSDIATCIENKGREEVESFLNIAEERTRRISESHAVSDLHSLIKEAKLLKNNANALGIRSLAYSAFDLELSCGTGGETNPSEKVNPTKVEIPAKIITLKRRLETCQKLLIDYN